MPKPRTVFVCSACGADSPRWQGQCPSCGEWNTMSAFNAPRKPRAAQSGALDIAASQAEPIGQITATDGDRLGTGYAEFDRVLGGGLVAGSVTLIGGDPGIGKSTLLLQCAAAMSAGVPVLYATGEESVRQVAERARRLAVQGPALSLISETSVERIQEE